MAARLAMLAPRLIALVVIWLLAAASWTLAAGGPQSSQPAAPAVEEPTRPDVLVVPDVRRQAYVFAKGILQDAGFAWRVEGPVAGYAANTVLSQSPAPGVRVVDNGAPTVVLRLERSSEYEERGVPENRSSYKGTSVVLLSKWQAAQKKRAQVTTETQPAATTTTSATAPAPTPAPAPSAAPEQGETSPGYRRPDFVVEGAPREPADEMPLPQRARALEDRAVALTKPNRKFMSHWLYQHAWLVTGARFGWKDGDDALRTLIQIDRSLYVRFGFGARSERVARSALAFVEARKP
jgi:beta-lactam-binding protein with PASTA domain